MHEHLFFRHYYNILALAGGLAEWAVAWWVLAGWGMSPPLLAHATVPALLAILNRVAARRLEHDPPRGVFAGSTGHVVLGVALAAIVGVGALGGVAVACVGIRLLLGFQAEAGVVSVGATDALVGLPFRLLGSLALGLSAAAVGYGYVRGHRELVVTDVDVPIAGLHPALAGLRIAHLSDLHVGPIAHRGALREALARVVTLDPDLICITGDIVDSPATDLGSWLPELATLSARHGVLAILGNHDQRVGFDRVADALAQWTPCRVLRDERVTVSVGEARVHVVGLSHQSAREAGPTLAGLMADVPPGEPVVLLAHHPNLFPVGVAHGADLTLCGHTHGGQLAMPGAPRLNIARLLITRHDAGTFAHAGAVLHVNRGLGASGQRVRVGAPREISVLRLVPAEATEAA